MLQSDFSCSAFSNTTASDTKQSQVANNSGDIVSWTPNSDSHSQQFDGNLNGTLFSLVCHLHRSHKMERKKPSPGVLHHAEDQLRIIPRYNDNFVILWCGKHQEGSPAFNTGSVLAFERRRLIVQRGDYGLWSHLEASWGRLCLECDVRRNVISRWDCLLIALSSPPQSLAWVMSAHIFMKFLFYVTVLKLSFSIHETSANIKQ